MSEKPIVRGRVERFYGDELVVGLSQREVILNRLTRLGADVSKKLEDEELGLARIELRNIAGAVARLRENPEIDRELQRLQGEYPEKHDKRPMPELDLLLAGLRAQFAADFSHWVPDMGKSRLLDQGLPHLGGGGVGDPVPGEPDEAASAPDREAGPRPRVAVMDTAVFLRPEIADHVFAAPETVIEPAESAAASVPGQHMKVNEGHGTFVTGLIVRRAPHAQLELHQVLDDDATGDGWEAAKELVRLAGAGVDIVNLSFGALTDDGQPPLVLARAVERLGSEIVIVAAAGNHGDLEAAQGGQAARNAPMWPAAFDDVIAVASGDQDLKLSAFSPAAPWVDLVALGERVTSSYLDGMVVVTRRAHDGRPEAIKEVGRFDGFARWSGTSFAAAIVSGELAARTVPGRISAREALRELRAGDSRQVRQFMLADLP